MSEISERGVALSRALSLPMIIFYGLGNILGAGIYVLVGKVAAHSAYLAPVSFLCAAVVACLTAFTYAELASRFPVSAGAAIYVHNGFNNRIISVITGLLIVLTGIVSAATIARGFAGYLDVFVRMPHWLTIIVILSLLGALAIWGIIESVRTAAIFTLIEIAGLILIITAGASLFEELPARIDQFVPSLDLGEWRGITLGAFLAFYAFVGFEDMVNVAEEVKNVRKNLPVAILLSLLIASILYIAVCSISVLAVEPVLLAQSEAPLADVYTRISGSSPYLISAISLFAVVNGALIQIIMSSRVCYGMSNQKWLPGWLGVINEKTRTPVNATLLITFIIIILALGFPLVTLASITSFCLLIIFALVNLALVLVKFRSPAGKDIFSIPVAVPVLGFVFCVLLLVLQSALSI